MQFESNGHGYFAKKLSFEGSLVPEKIVPWAVIDDLWSVLAGAPNSGMGGSA